MHGGLGAAWRAWDAGGMGVRACSGCQGWWAAGWALQPFTALQAVPHPTPMFVLALCRDAVGVSWAAWAEGG